MREIIPHGIQLLACFSCSVLSNKIPTNVRVHEPSCIHVDVCSCPQISEDCSSIEASRTKTCGTTAIICEPRRKKDPKRLEIGALPAENCRDAAFHGIAALLMYSWKREHHVNETNCKETCFGCNAIRFALHQPTMPKHYALLPVTSIQPQDLTTLDAALQALKAMSP